VALRSHSLYQEAERACAQKQWQAAAGRLERLAQTPGLSEEERAFCQRQKAIVLTHLSPAAPVPPPAPVVVKPVSNADCGPRALQRACQELGVATTIEQLRTLAGTTRQGTTLEGLKCAAEAVGVQAEGVQVSREALAEVALPAIAWVQERHYVVLLKLEGSGEQATATIYDPNKADAETLPREQFLRLCSGYLLLLQKK
jgi:hypothetical protein